MIRLEDVTKRFASGQAALKNLTMSVDKGEMVFVTGHSGAGKSTLLRLIALIERPAESQVGLFKLEPNGKEAVRVSVRLGRSSVNEIEIVNGLQPGDVVILSDLSQYDSSDRIRIN
jgi:ABC-type ATPase involved in cell division